MYLISTAVYSKVASSYMPARLHINPLLKLIVGNLNTL